MTDQSSDITLDSSTTTNSNTTTTTSTTTNSDQLPLTRTSSFSKLNAKAPEFVPMRPSHSPPPLSAADPRLLIVPPPSPPPSGMVHVYPPTPMPVPIPVRGPPHLHPMHHYHHLEQPPHRQNNGGNNHHISNNNNNSRLTKQHSNKEQQQEGGKQSDKDKDHGSASSRSNNNVNSNGLTDEAAQKLINQVEYYFSDVNLATTDHLIKFIFKDSEGYVPVSVVASFKKIKALISSNSQLAAVLRNSTKLVVSEDGKKVKRLHPLTSSDMEELQARIVVAENLPEDHCHQNLMKIFSVVGRFWFVVKSIRTCQPQPANNGGSSASRSSKADNFQYNNKLHAFVEYDTVELAEKAIAELNDEDSWRNGLRVRPLLKQVMKSPGRAKKSGNEGEVNCEEVSVSTSEQNQNEKPSESIAAEADTQVHEHGEEQSMDKEAGQKKSRNRAKGKGRGRGHNNNHNHHHQTNRGSNAGGPHSSNGYNAVIGEQLVVAKQQPPGPRMPDGTRGFSMGRGRPLTVSTA